MLRGMLVAFSSDNFCFNVVLKCLFGFCWLWLCESVCGSFAAENSELCEKFPFPVGTLTHNFFFIFYSSFIFRPLALESHRVVCVVVVVCACASAYSVAYDLRLLIFGTQNKNQRRRDQWHEAKCQRKARIGYKSHVIVLLLFRRQ